MMDDREFLNYMDAHSDTEKALFSRDHVRRFLLLAGKDPELYNLSSAFMAMHKRDIGGFLKEARERLEGAQS